MINYFDLHCDTVTRAFDLKQPLRSNKLHLSLDKKPLFGRWAQCFAIFLPDTLSAEQAYGAYKRYLAFYNGELKDNSDLVQPLRSAQDLDQNNRCAAVLTLENAALLDQKLERVEQLYRDGVRMATLTWNGKNCVASGCAASGGLSEFGREALAEMERLGMVLDLSHLSDAGVAEVFERYSGPLAASHSNLRAVCGAARNLTDAQFKEIARRGGVVGLNMYVNFIEEGGAATIGALLRHIDRMLELGGRGAIAFGGDFDGADLPDFANGTAAIPALYRAVAEHYNDPALADDIFFNNAARFFKKHLG